MSKSLTIRKPFTRVRVAIKPKGESLTEQAHCEGDALSVKNVLFRYQRTGDPSLLNPRTPLDLDEVPNMSLQDILQFAATAKETFESLPAKIRKEFNNDALEYMKAFDDKENVEVNQKLLRLGLLKKEKVEPEVIQKVTIVDDSGGTGAQVTEKE